MRQNIQNNFKVVLLLFVICLTSCKRNYSCRCGSPLIDSEPFIIRDTKKNATKICADKDKEAQAQGGEMRCSIIK